MATNKYEYQIAQAITCQTVIVDDPDGYINVRSTPEVKANNIVSSLLNGVKIKVVRERGGWLQINAPVQGWVASNRTAVCCANNSRDIDGLMRTISDLGEQAIRGNQDAGESLVKMLVDGAFADLQGVVLARWAGKNPNFLINILDRQSQTLRRKTLSSIKYSFGDTQSGARKNFENALARLPRSNPTVQDWAYISNIKSG